MTDSVHIRIKGLGGTWGPSCSGKMNESRGNRLLRNTFDTASIGWGPIMGLCQHADRLRFHNFSFLDKHLKKILYH